MGPSMKTRIFTLLGLIAFTFSPVHADDVERFRDIIDTNDDAWFLGLR